MKKNDNILTILFQCVNVVFLCLFCIVMIYPFIYVISASISEPHYIEAGEVLLTPKGLNLQSYRDIIRDKFVWRGYSNTILYSFGSAFIGVLITYFTAYPLSKKTFTFSNFFTFLVTFTMFFSGGMVPKYLVINAMGMVDTIWAIILPTACHAWYVLLVRNYLKSLPESLEESALIDGANEFVILFRIIIPLSLPILATITLFYIVKEWNSVMPPLIYLSDYKKFPLQVVLYRLVILSETSDLTETSLDQIRQRTLVTVKYAVIVAATLPLLVIYPFIQRYFVKGIMVGAIKG